MSGITINAPPQTVSEALNGGISDRGSFEGSPEQSQCPFLALLLLLKVYLTQTTT